MDGRIYFPHNENLLKDVKLEEKERKETLIIQRDTKNILELEYFPAFHFKELIKDDILNEMTKKTESKLSGWTHEEQKKYLNKEIAALKIENEILKNAFTDKHVRPILLDLMLYAKYILQYRKSGTNHDKELYYINLFKENLTFLIDKFPEVKQLIHELADTNHFLRILPLAYDEIIKSDQMLVEFRASELVGHNAAYAVARNEAIKNLIIVDKGGNILEKYSLNLIKVMKNNKRDLGLKGLILIPSNYKEEEETTIYITWAGTHNPESRSADLERAPGEESYRLGEDQIVKQILDCIKALNRPVKIVICGHSLGGALSQLTFHSLQRVIAMNLTTPEIPEYVAELEKKFSNELKKLSPHQRDISHFKINPSIIKEMSVDVWNYTGVLQPVINHTNDLCPILVNHNVQQICNIGQVHGDVAPSFGHGFILNNVPVNGAKIKILKVQPAATATLLTTLGVPAATAGLTLFGVNPFGWFSSLICVGALLYKVLSDKSYAHRKHHFKNGTRPEDAYIIYKSHHPDGSPNMEHCKLIQKELANQSLGIFDSSLDFISDVMMQDERFQSEYQHSVDTSSTESKSYVNTFQFLISRIKNPADGIRIINLINDKQIQHLINMTDDTGKTLLHHALLQDKLDIAVTLLKTEGVNVNVVDKDKNSPLLLFMRLVHNSYLPIAKSTYQLGLNLLEKTTLDLNLQNVEGQSVASIYKKWYWSGLYAKSFMLALGARLKPVEEVKPVVRGIVTPK